jgi:hypothetical protein
MITRATTMGRLRTELTIARPDLDAETWLATIAPRIGADARIRRVSGQVISVAATVDLILRAADAQARPVQALQGTEPPEVDLIAMKNRFLALRASQAEAPRSIGDVLTRLASPLDRIGSGR